jgi:DNA-binding MarR family transcriptional regulator
MTVIDAQTIVADEGTDLVYTCMVQATECVNDLRSVVLGSVGNPANAATIGALTDLLWLMQRSRLLRQQGGPAKALVVHLYRCGPMRSSDLAGAMNLDHSTVSRHLAHLEESGFIDRAPDPVDGRAHLVAVSATGRELADQVIATRVRHLEQVIDTWSDNDRDDLSRLLTRFTDDYSALHVDGPPP